MALAPFFDEVDNVAIWDPMSNILAGRQRTGR